MDKNIRSLLAVAKKYGAGAGRESMDEAYRLMKSTADTQLMNDGPEAFGLDLYVVCAEIALELGLTDMAKSCLKLFFVRSPPANQFLIRAYLCQGMLLAPTTAEDVEQLEKAVVYLLKAIAIAKENSRYHFLVYNASVIYWQFCRPFLKPQYRQHVARGLHQVVKALDDIEDKDYEWRAQLMIALIECHMDAGRKQDASHIAAAAATFIKQNVPSLYKTVFGLMVRHQLVDSEKFRKDIRTSAELNVFHRICRLRGAIESKELEKDSVDEMRKILALITGQPDEPPKKASERPGRRSATPEDGHSVEKKRGSPTRVRTRTPTPPGPRKSIITSPDKPYLLLELGRLALEQDQPEISEQCIELIKQCIDLVQDESFFLELEFLQSDQLIKSLKENQQSYHPDIIQLRVQAIKRCDEAITNAVRLKAATVIQTGCVTQWNLCLPLVQNNLRNQCRRPLTNVSNALQSLQSLLIQLRCQVHMELAKCEEDQEQIQVAIDHLHKALSLDDGEVYKERLEVALHRLELRAELYQTPERAEDQAAMIIEQARKADSGTMRMKRSLLVRAGQTLAPDAFLLVLDSENDSKEAAKGVMTPIKKLALKTQQFKKCVRKAEGHLRRLGNENDRERAQLWGDLARTARKQEVWDVCRVATRFCLLYDDGRWKNEPLIKESIPKRSKSQDRNESQDGGETDRAPSELTRERKSREPTVTTSDKDVPLYDKDLIRMMAEVNFINGESLIHLLRSHQVELGDKPVPPEDRSKRPKGYIPKKTDQDPDWLEYCDWISAQSQDAVQCFLRAASLGIELREAWIVCSSAAYIWNYNNHIMTDNRHKEIIESLQTVLTGFKKVGHAGETILLVNVCNSLATGLIQPWLPAAEMKGSITPDQPPEGDKESPRRGAGKGPQAAASKTKTGPTIPAEALPDLKKAVEVCEYAMKITNGDNQMDVVPIAIRYTLLQTWVCARQMSQQQIAKSLGADDERSTEGQAPMTRGIVAVEMLSCNPNGIMEFRECPSLQQAVDMVSGCAWTDHLIELQLWTRLAYLALDAKTHAVVVTCAQKALAFAESGTGKHQDSHKYIVEQEMLHYAACIYGQSLIRNTQGKNSVRRKAMQQFLESARFAKNAANYDLVITAARHYWNACLSLINQPMERELLKEPLTILLQCITDTTDKNIYKKEEEEEDAEATPRPQSAKSIPPVQASSNEDPATDAPPTDKQAEEVIGQPKASTGAIGGPDDDLTLRASLYGVLFQSYADKGEWDAGLKAMEQAINDMPRTNHRLLIFKHLVVVKAKIGLGVGMSIQKFKDEREDYVAHMWRRVALCSRETQEQLQAYQNAIEALSSPWADWQKFDYLIEFGQWLYCNEFPLQDAMDQIEWAIDILLNMKYEQEKSRRSTAKTKKGAKGKRSAKTPPASNTKLDKKGKKTEKPASKEPQSAKKKGKEPEKKALVRGAETSDSEAEQNTKDVVPVHKEAVIGVLPNNPSLTSHDLCNITQLEGLFRAHTIQAQLAGRSSMYYRDYCLMAYSFIIRIWQASLSNAGPVMKEIVKQQANEAQESKNSAKGKKKEAKESQSEKKERPKRKGPLDHVPATVDEWALYDAPDEAIEAFKHQLMANTGINAKTILKPTLTLFYLDTLTTELRHLGYNHLVLPLLALADILTRDIIEDRPMNALVHLRALEVCVELNISQGVSFHDKLAQYKLNEDEQANAHQEMALWQERQLQVTKEERRIKEALSKYKTETRKQHMTQRDREILQKLQDMEENESSSHLGQEVGALHIYETWTQTAEVLIRNGIYQPARELLNEAHISAKVFDNKRLRAQVLYLLGQLSYYEAQYGQAVGFANEAQQLYDGDEMFWYKTTTLIVDSYIKDFSQKDKIKLRKARAVLVNALNTFNQVSDVHPNKTSITGYILAMLEAKLGAVQIQILLNEHENILRTKIITALTSASKKVHHGYESLLNLGYHQEALTVMKDQASLYVHLAKITPMNVDKHEFYIQALSVLQHTVQVSGAIWNDILTSSALLEMKCLNCRAQREVIETKLLCSELMMQMFALYVDEQREDKLVLCRKGSTLRAVEELVRETPDYTDGEKQWLDTISVIGETTLTLLSEAHTLSANIVELKTRCMTCIGRCLQLLGLHKGPDIPVLWRIQEMEALRMTQHIENTPIPAPSEDGQNEEEMKEKEIDTSSREYMKNSQQITNMKMELELSHNYTAKSTEILTQAVNLSLSKGLLESASCASLELVECCGQFDPSMACQYLTLHQSCQASLYLRGLLKKALYDPQLSQQGALMHQLHNLMSSNIQTNASHGPVMKTLQNTLSETSEAWKRLQVSPQHMDLTKEFPSIFNFVLLQHSPDKSKLYGCVLDKPKSSGGGGGKGAPKNPTVQSMSAKAKVVSMDTTPERLEALLSRYRWYRHDIMQTLLKKEYQHSQMAQRDKMMANLDENIRSMDIDGGLVREWEADERRLHDNFLELVAAMDTYLQPITAQIEPMLSRPQSVAASETNRARVTKDEPTQEYVILLLDQHLMELPLEALQCFQSDNITSVTREISLQMLYHKFHVEPLDEAAEKAKKEKEKNKPQSRIPGLRDASKKTAKLIPLDRPINPGFVPVDTHAFRFICDPHLDCSETEANKPIESFNNMMEEHIQQFTTRWLGVAGDEHAPSMGEYEVYMMESSSFIFYGMERFLCHLPPHKVAALNLPECQFVMLLDLTQTNKSFSRQAKTDVLKTADVLSLEKPTEAAMLLGLTGVRSVCVNQWHCTLQENAQRVQAFMKDLLAKGKSLGETTRLMFNPNKRREEEKVELQAQLDAEEAKKGGAGAAKTEAKTTTTDEDGEEEEEELEEPPLEMGRHWYNLVCYGLPNLIVTQIGKG